jgi:hypothetical protein
VVLTDGLPNPSTPADALAAATAAKEAGLVVVTIAFGPDADPSLLEQMASGPEHAHAAPDAAALLGIFREIPAAWDPCYGIDLWPQGPGSSDVRVQQPRLRPVP